MSALKPIHCFPARMRSFTLIELLLALVLTAAAMAVAFASFHSISKAWQRGQAMSDDLNRGDYVMSQLYRGLRSAFYPPVKSRRMDYGFFLENDGNGEEARDAISWVKTGDALLPADSPIAGGTHRVRISIEKDADDEWSIVSRAWPPHVNSALFDYTTIAPLALSRKIVGFDCRVATNCDENGWDWQDVWEDAATNHLPLAVELSLYLTAPDPGDAPVCLKRLVEIPLGPHSWNAKPAREEHKREDRKREKQKEDEQ